MKPDSAQDEATIEQAHEWYNIMRNPTVQQRADFVRWLKASPRNVGEFLTASAVQSEFEGPGYAASMDIKSMLLEENPNVVPLRHTVAETPVRTPHMSGVKTRRLWQGVAALAIVLAVSAVWTWMGAEVYVTSRGEQRTIALADGSKIQLNTDSKARVHFSNGLRDVELEHGEALFTVARDPSRPFVVRSGDAVVQALGTQFDVYRRPDGVAVSVLEGRVAVTDRRAKRDEVLDAGVGTEVLTGSTLVPAKSIDVARVVAWREKRLVFKSDRLSDIAAEFNRYNSAVRFDVQIPPVGEKRFTGVFDANAPQSFARLLEDSPRLEVVRTKTGYSVRYR